MSLRICLAVLLFIEAGVTAFGPDRDILTPAHQLFFSALPRGWWALAQLLVGVILILTRTSARYQYTGRYLAAAVTATWCTVTLLPAFDGRPWAAVSTILWATLTALAAASTSARIMVIGAIMWAAMAVAVAVAPDQALAAPAVQDLLTWAGHAPVALLCAVTAALVGYRATWPSKVSFTVSTGAATVASAAWALVWLWPAFSGRPYNLVAFVAWTWLAATSLYGLGRRNLIPVYARPLPIRDDAPVVR